MENQSTYRIRTNLGDNNPINIPVRLMQEYNSFEILSLKINTDDTYHSYTSTEGIVVGRVSTANNGLGIPNVRVSIFVPKGMYNQSDEEAVLYPFSSPTDLDGDRVRYNLLPSDSDVDCYQVIGTLPTKRKILDNETVLEVFEKYYKYTTVTNEAGDFMLSNIPVGKQRIHIDADLSDIGPFLSQKPYDMIENLGFEKNRFESTRQFKTSNDLDSLAQVITQNKSVYVYPYWGDATEKGAEMKITRTDLSLNYDFKTSAVFIGSVITDKQSNSIRQNCTATERAGKMSDMVTGPGRIEMIRKTIDNKIEQYRIKGDMLINDNGVWCYSIPMNLDYVRTDEFGNIIPTDDPNKGVPTRARVRFRVTINQMDSDEDAHKRCSYLVPNNPKFDDEKFLKENDADYSFGSDTWDESFVDLFWNKVYTVKNYVPRIQKTVRPTNRKHTGIKMVNHFGDNNPFPYNGLSIKLSFLYRLICVIVHIFITLVWFINKILSAIGALPCWIAEIKILGKPIFKKAMKMVPSCIELSSEFCDDGINKNVTFPGCSGCVWTNKTKPDCDKEQYNISQNSGEAAVCTNNDSELFNCVENQLAQDNEATSFNFGNDWINGCLYMPLWYRHIRPKKSFFFGLFKKRAKDQWCAGEKNENGRMLKMASFCSHSNSRGVESKNYKGDKINYHITKYQDNCGNGCHEVVHWVGLTNGLIMNRENMLGQKVWYYKAVEVVSAASGNFANEYENFDMTPMVSKTLYATDIVLLGSMNDCDLNGIPKFFNYLKGSSYNMPTDILFTDTELNYEFDEKGNLVEQTSQKISVASGCDWGNKNEYGYNDGGLFYSIGCSSIKVNTESCVNLRRICELGVGQDEMQYIENIDTHNATGIGGVNISNETDELDYNNPDYYLRPDGYVSYDDIIDFDYRSMFATMNSNRLKTLINKKNGVKEYDFRHLYIDNFDGSLEELMKSKLSERGKANYRFNYNLEKTNSDYLLFRMSDRPYFYDGNSLVRSNENNGPGVYTLPKYQNSFYFYFGLKEGKTAIDLFNEQYNGSCSTKSEEDESIAYEKMANGWCSVDSDSMNTFNHKTYDGYLKLNLENLPLPCTAILNSKVNKSVTYTITRYDGNTNINDEKICFYGNNIDEETIDRGLKGYRRYYFRYENPLVANSTYPDGVDTKNLDVEGDEENIVKDETKGPCVMLSNGEYNLYIIDGEGNQHSFVINLNGEYLQFDDVEKKFGQPNNILLKYYKTPGETGKSIPYHQVSISPTDNKTFDISVDESGVPVVKRLDKSMNEVVNKNVIQGKEVKLNGTICLYNIFYNNERLDKFIIEVEPYDKEKIDGKDQYIDEDFHLSKTDKDKTWYQKKVFFDHTTNNLCKDCYIKKGSDGREYISVKDESKYFYYNDNVIVNNLNYRLYIIKCPKGNVNYRVRVTQLCQNNKGEYYKSQNYIERKINVAQPTPYKLLINDADYDIIRNFKTGWKLDANKGRQTEEDLTKDLSPFKGVGNFSEIKGWLTISDINKNYAWGEDSDKYGTENQIFELCKDGSKYGDEYIGEYELKAALELKESLKPKEPQRFNYTDDSKYNDDYNQWQKDMDEWENGWSTEGGLRDNNYKNWESISKNKRLGGPCGYKHVKEAAQILLNRLDFVDKMKSSFWIQCENSEKTIAYSVRTDDNPYDVWSIYNPEYVSPTDENYNETQSKPNDGGKERDLWQCIGESTRSITGIKIPNITSFESKDFGISEDSSRINNYKTSYDEERTKCFGQDNIAENSRDSGSVSIKPPYLVACVNYEGLTKPENLKKGEFYDQESEENKYGLKPYKFGEIGSNKRYVNDGTYEFFQFYLIDKIFSPEIVSWAYMNNIPYFRPWYDYDEETSNDNRLGYSIKTEGIISGIIKNGITNSKGVVTDFDTKNIFDKDVKIKTFNGATEDDIPTKRCILFGDIDEEKENDLVYINYRHTDGVDETNQYRPVPNREGELDFIDRNGNCETTRTLYGSMKINLKSNTLNDTSFQYVEFLGHKFQTSGGENGDNTLTLKVSCSNSDTDRPITYYIFQASMKEEVSVGEAYSTRKLWYPLNAFEIETDYIDDKGETKPYNPYRYHLKCEDKIDRWDGSTQLASQLFNKNTLENDLRDKYSDKSKDLAWKKSQSQVQWENEYGETKFDDTTGYGNTGVFANLDHVPYFVVAITENGCRAISPVYDFHIIYYVAGLVELEGGQKVLRTALVYVLKHISTKNNADADGYKSTNIGIMRKDDPEECRYCKKPRNYYLTQYDFTISYTFANGTTLITNEGINYEKTNVKFEDITGFTGEEAIGTSYIEVKGTTPNATYVINTYNGGQFSIGEELDSEPSGDKVQPGQYQYTTKEPTTGEIYYVIVTVGADGEIRESDKLKEDQGLNSIPNGYVTVVRQEQKIDSEGNPVYDGDGNPVMADVTKYVSLTYSTVTMIELSYDPRIPYFMRFNDKSLTDDEYNSLKILFSMSLSEIEKNAKCYVTDVTKLKHKCKLHRIVTKKEDWNKIFTNINKIEVGN